MAEKQKMTGSLNLGKSYNDLFGEKKEAAQAADIPAQDLVQHLTLDLLDDYADHTFSLGSDEELQSLADSIRDEGVINPIIVRAKDDGRYEIIAGHRRTAAARLAGLGTIRAFVRDMDDDEATILMVRTNLEQRQLIKHSEKAWSYRKMLEAMKRKAGRLSHDNGSQPGNNLVGTKSSDMLSENIGVSKNQIFRFIRLTYLNDELLDQIDKGTLAFGTGVTLSYLLPEEQDCLINVLAIANMKPSDAIATLMKEESIKRQKAKAQPLTEEDLNDIWITFAQPQKKAKDINDLKLPFNIVRRYYPDDMPQDKIIQDIIQATRIYNIVKQDPELLHRLTNK